MPVTVSVKHTILIGVLLFAGVMAGGSSYLVLNGRGMILSRLGALTGRQVSVRSLRPVFPPGLMLKNFMVEGRLRSERVTVRVDPMALFQGRLVLTDIDLDRPEINIDIRHDDALALEPDSSVNSGAGGVPPERIKAFGIIRDVRIHNGTLMLQMPSTGRTWVVDRLEVALTNVAWGNGSGRVGFFATGSMASLGLPFVGPLAKVQGWIDWARRDMEAHAEAFDQEGRVGFEAQVISKSNDLNVTGRVHLSPAQSEQSLRKRPRLLEGAVLDALRATKADMDAGFFFVAKLDHPVPKQIKLDGLLTTELQSQGLSSNIVGNLKAVGEKLLKLDEPAPTIKPSK